MTKVDLKESIVKGEPKETLKLEGPYFDFSIRVERLDTLKAELEMLRDKLNNLDAKMFSIVNAGLSAKAPRLPAKNFELGAVLYEDTVKAIIAHVYKKMDFDPKPKQQTLKDSAKKGKK